MAWNTTICIYKWFIYVTSVDLFLMYAFLLIESKRINQTSLYPIVTQHSIYSLKIYLEYCAISLQKINNIICVVVIMILSVKSCLLMLCSIKQDPFICSYVYCIPILWHKLRHARCMMIICFYIIINPFI